MKKIIFGLILLGGVSISAQYSYSKEAVACESTSQGNWQNGCCHDCLVVKAWDGTNMNEGKKYIGDGTGTSTGLCASTQAVMCK